LVLLPLANCALQPPSCGMSGPMYWFNAGTSDVITAQLGAPLGLLFGLPAVFGCTPTQATSSNLSATISFEYWNNSPLISTCSSNSEFSYSNSYDSNTEYITGMDLSAPAQGNIAATYDDSDRLIQLEVLEDSSFFRVFVPRINQGFLSHLVASVSYKYDDDRLPNQHTSMMFNTSEGSFQIGYSYNILSNGLISMITINASGVQEAIQLNYDANYDVITSLQSQDLGAEIDFSYDSQNRLIGITNSGNTISQLGYVSDSSQSEIAFAYFGSSTGNLTFSNSEVHIL